MGKDRGREGMPGQIKIHKNVNLEAKLRTVCARDIMTKNVMTINQLTPLSEVASIMIKQRVNGMPVVGKNGNLVGIVTTTDLFIVLAMIMEGNTDKFGVTPTDPVVDVAMATEIIGVKEATTLEEILKLIRSESIHTIPVLDGDKLVGIIGRHDVLKKFYEIAKTCNL